MPEQMKTSGVLRPAYRFDRLLPLLVLAAGLVATFFMQQAASNAERRIQRDNFAHLGREIKLRIEQRLAAYEKVMYGVKGLYIASMSVERDEFRDYVANLRLADNFPGIQGIGFSLIVPPLEKSGHVEAIRKEGFPAYRLHPEGERDLYTSIIYIEPFSGVNLRAFGYDMYAEDVRSAAMQQARDLDEMSISGRVTLIQETSEEAQSGFLMYLPVYHNGRPHETMAERRASIMGWVYAPFRMNDLMAGILGEMISKVDLHIYADESASHDTMMYDNDRHLSGRKSEASLYRLTERIRISGTDWYIEVRSLPEFDADIDTFKVNMIRIAGITVSVLLALLVWQLASGRTRAYRIAHDMTRELRESEERFRQLTENIREVFWMTDPGKNKMLYVSPAYEHVWGKTQQSLYASPQDWLESVHRDDRERVQQALAMQAAGLYDEEFRIVRPDGEIRWIHDCAFPVRDSTGEVYRIAGVAEDVTERRQAEAEFRIAATAFETQDGMVITDANSVIMRVNCAFTAITGYTAEEAVGRTPRMLSSGRHDAAFYAAMWESIRRAGTWQGEIWNRRKNGEIYPERLSITAVKGEGGATTHYVATLHDITERKKAEETINNLAFYDTLTQLPNRRLLNDRMGKAMAASRRSGRNGALMFIDMDNFKPLNDRYGHDVGDLLLIEVARRLSGCVREIDTVARFGGDEFVVMLCDLDTDKVESATQAGMVAEKIRRTLSMPYLLNAGKDGMTGKNIEHDCAASIGVVIFDCESGIEDIFKYADMAMYQAKYLGRNQVHFYGS